MKRLGLFMILAATAGCTAAAGEGSGGIRVAQANLGGSAVFVGGPGAGFGFAEFYSNVSGGSGEDFVVDFGTDECDLPETGGTSPTFTYVDAGANVTFTGPVVYTAVKSTSGGMIAYQGPFLTTAHGAGDYTVANSGSADFAASTIGTIVIPTPAALDGSGDITTPGSQFDFTWTGGDGADFINIDVYDANDDVVYTCNAQNDGSFSLDSTVTTAAGTGGYVQIFAQTYSVGDANGREVVMVGLGL